MFFKFGNIQFTTNFNQREFDCSCRFCSLTVVDLKLMTQLQLFRDHLGKSIKITSGYRCETYNREIGGVKNSQHALGKAADIVVNGMNTEDLAKEAKKFFTGVGTYDTFVHVDVRDKKTYWKGK